MQFRIQSQLDILALEEGIRTVLHCQGQQCAFLQSAPYKQLRIGLLLRVNHVITHDAPQQPMVIGNSPFMLCMHTLADGEMAVELRKRATHAVAASDVEQTAESNPPPSGGLSVGLLKKKRKKETPNNKSDDVLLETQFVQSLLAKAIRPKQKVGIFSTGASLLEAKPVDPLLPSSSATPTTATTMERPSSKKKREEEEEEDQGVQQPSIKKPHVAAAADEELERERKRKEAKRKQRLAAEKAEAEARAYAEEAAELERIRQLKEAKRKQRLAAEAEARAHAEQTAESELKEAKRKKRLAAAAAAAEVSSTQAVEVTAVDLERKKEAKRKQRLAAAAAAVEAEASSAQTEEPTSAAREKELEQKKEAKRKQRLEAAAAEAMAHAAVVVAAEEQKRKQVKRKERLAAIEEAKMHVEEELERKQAKRKERLAAAEAIAHAEAVVAAEELKRKQAKRKERLAAAEAIAHAEAVVAAQEELKRKQVKRKQAQSEEVEEDKKEPVAMTEAEMAEAKLERIRLRRKKRRQAQRRQQRLEAAEREEKAAAEEENNAKRKKEANAHDNEEDIGLQQKKKKEAVKQKKQSQQAQYKSDEKEPPPPPPPLPSKTTAKAQKAFISQTEGTGEVVLMTAESIEKCNDPATFHQAEDYNAQAAAAPHKKLEHKTKEPKKTEDTPKTTIKSKTKECHGAPLPSASLVVCTTVTVTGKQNNNKSSSSSNSISSSNNNTQEQKQNKKSQHHNNNPSHQHYLQECRTSMMGFVLQAHVLRRVIINHINNRVQDFPDPITSTLVLLASSPLQIVFCEEGLMLFKTAHLPIFPYTLLSQADRDFLRDWLEKIEEPYMHELYHGCGKFSVQVGKSSFGHLPKRELLLAFVHIMLHQGEIQEKVILQRLADIIIQRFLSSVSMQAEDVNAVMAHLWAEEEAAE